MTPLNMLITFLCVTSVTAFGSCSGSKWCESNGCTVASQGISCSILDSSMGCDCSSCSYCSNDDVAVPEAEVEDEDEFKAMMSMSSAYSGGDTDTETDTDTDTDTDTQTDSESETGPTPDNPTRSVQVECVFCAWTEFNRNYAVIVARSLKRFLCQLGITYERWRFEVSNVPGIDGSLLYDIPDSEVQFAGGCPTKSIYEPIMEKRGVTTYLKQTCDGIQVNADIQVTGDDSDVAEIATTLDNDDGSGIQSEVQGQAVLDPSSGVSSDTGDVFKSTAEVVVDDGSPSASPSFSSSPSFSASVSPAPPSTTATTTASPAASASTTTTASVSSAPASATPSTSILASPSTTTTATASVSVSRAAISDEDDEGLSDSEVAAVVVGGIAGAALLGAGAVYFMSRKSMSSTGSAANTPSYGSYDAQL